MISDDPNHDAGLSAVSNAQAGNWALLRARLCDPAITLTMFEREWLARERLPGKSGRPKEAQEPLLYWWFRHAEGMEHPDAIQRVCKALNRTSASGKEAIERAIRRAGGEGYDPGEWWHRCGQWYREGNRNPQIFPSALRAETQDFAEFLRTRTE